MSQLDFLRFQRDQLRAPVGGDSELDAVRITTIRNLDSQINYMTEVVGRLQEGIRIHDESDVSVHRFDWEISGQQGSERETGQ